MLQCTENSSRDVLLYRSNTNFTISRGICSSHLGWL